MKGLFYRFAVSLMIIALTLPISTQAFGGSTDAEARTQLEAFLTQKGILLIKEFYDLGTVPGMYGSEAHFVAVVIYEPGRENQKVKGLKIEITSGGRFEKKESSFLDQEELQELSDAIQYMIRLALEWQGNNRNYTEVVYSTKGDFSIGFFQNGLRQTAFASSGRISKVVCFFSQVQELKKVKSLVDNAQDLLATK